MRLLRLALTFALFIAASSSAGAQSLPASCTNWTDYPFVARVTVIKAVHLSELRACVGDLRAQRGLPAYSWTYPTIIPEQSTIHAADVMDLRAALADVYAAANITAPQYTDGTLTAGLTDIRGFQISEIRTAAMQSPPPCFYSVFPPGVVVPGNGINGSVSVTAPSGCTWSATSPVEWITIGPGGIGAGLVSYMVAPNTGFSDRSATLAIAGYSVLVTQEVDLISPRIFGSGNPGPNAAGWSRAPVTVTFTCTAGAYPIAFCSPQYTQFSDTMGAVVVGEAIDQAGNRATVSVTLRIDRRAPRLTVFSPEPGDAIPTDSTTVTIRGVAMDGFSGIDTVTCAAIPATVVGQGYVCNVPVILGAQTVHLVARDIAGNIAMRDTIVTVADPPPPASISLSPKKMTLAAGETRRVTFVDERGRRVIGGELTMAGPTVAEVLVQDDEVSVHGLSAGVTTMTLTRNGLTAQGTITVLAGGTIFSDGTAIWELDGTLTLRGDVLRPMWILDVIGEQPALVFVDEGVEWVGSALQRRFARPTQIRATSLDGRLLWQHSFTNTTIKHVAADNYGGIVMVLANTFNTSEPLPERIRRLDGLTGKTSWEYFSDDGPLSEVAIHPDGTVYVVDSPYYSVDVELVALNGQTGSTRGRWPLPRGHFRRYQRLLDDSLRLDVDGDTSPDVTAPIVREDNTVAVMSRRTFSEIHYPLIAADQPWTYYDIQLGVIEDSSLPHPVLAVTDLIIRDYSTTWKNVDLRQYRLFPDGQQGLLVANKTLPVVFRADANGVVTPRRTLLPLNALETDYALGEDGAYALVNGRNSNSTYWTRVVHFDPATLATISEASLGVLNRPQPSQLRLRSALAGGGILTTGPTETYLVNATISAGGLPIGGNASHVSSGLWGGWQQGQALMAGGVGPSANTVWAQQRGAQGQNVAVDARKGIFAKSHWIVPGAYRHVAVRMVPTNQPLWRQQADTPFVQQETGGQNWFATIGAGPKPEGGCSGLLEGRLNRPNDVTATALDLEKLPVPAQFEDLFLTRLLQAVTNYPDDLTYECLPDSGTLEYNSNSFARGILRAVRLPEPMFPAYHLPQFPGWLKPVPLIKFGPIP